MQVLQELINSLTADQQVTAGIVGPHLIAVASRRLGLAATLDDPRRLELSGLPGESEILIGRSANELARWLLSEDWLKAGIGMAALNSLLEVSQDSLSEGNAKQIIATQAAGKDLAVVGHFPFVQELRPKVRNLWIMEKRPRPGDLTEEEGYQVLGVADVVAITGSSLVNHTFQRIMVSCRPEAVKIVLGPSTPLSPILFEFGIDVIGGALVEKEEVVLAMVGKGAPFRRLEGVRTVVLTKE